VLSRNKANLDQRQFKRRFGSIFIIYKKECWFWEVWIKVKKLFVLLTLNLFPEHTVYQVMVALVVLEVAIHFSRARKPFRYSQNNPAQFTASLCNLTMLFSGLVFFSGRLDAAGSHSLVVVVTAFTAYTTFTLFRAFATEFVAYYGKKLAEDKPALRAVFNTALCERLCGSRSALAKDNHWAGTEDLLDKYSKAVKAKWGEKEQPLLLEGDDDKSTSDPGCKKPVRTRRRSLVAVGDIGQDLKPDKEFLQKLFFKEESLEPLELWQSTVATPQDLNDFQRLLQSIKGAAELEQMRHEIARLDGVVIDNLVGASSKP